jgi:hypothetical protein
VLRIEPHGRLGGLLPTRGQRPRPPGSPLLTVVYYRAVDLRALGDYERARAPDEDTVARYLRVLGDDHSHTLAGFVALSDRSRSVESLAGPGSNCLRELIEGRCDT